MKRRENSRLVPLINALDRFSMIAEQYRTIRSNIQFISVDQAVKTLVVTSAGPEEGKSTVSANLAIVFANSGKKILLVDADLRKPSVADTFQFSVHTKGLTNLLGEKEKTLEAYVNKTGMDHLWIMTSGPKPSNPSEMLDSMRMKEIIEGLKMQFDLVIFDMPPVATVTDAQILASKTDGTLLVVRERKTSKHELVKAKKLLTMAQANILGVIYNGAKENNDFSYYY
ncbi:CpsD/CapB family tyrosine-protein kinase [Enterococcus ratti]|uniref:Tyrosine-protein kinase CpsD n=1 Tax=Enterococcus ratti TaxID=150033 RepID=A0A1L8WIJ3_9ENTE|nr:CpsD/CapB family tyrosine-protein kinase [Enterococcus ratti]OJG80846.1 capsular exopolysaccharide family protein [Enterococcus ratti]